MESSKKVLAVDLGSSGGKFYIGRLNNSGLEISEVHRFSNDPVHINGEFYWDVLRLYHEIVSGMHKCKFDFDSVGIDTWGVDYGLIDKYGSLIGNPRHYRDNRTASALRRAVDEIGISELYGETGIAIIWFNTVYQLMAERNLDNAETLLFMPDLLNYFLTGKKCCERTIASTSQLYNPAAGEFSQKLLDYAKARRSLFAPLVEPGTIVGGLTMSDKKVIAVASHDTASAVAAVPFSAGSTAAFISCGSWSLMGTELDAPCITKKARKYNFTNEAGVMDTVSFHKNIMGSWLVQECMRQWEREGESLSFKELDPQTAASAPFVSLIDVDDESFQAPENMPKNICGFLIRTNQPLPPDKPAMLRAITDSLALKYRITIEQLEEILGKRFDTIHMVGGGIKDRLLCQMTANVTKRRVIAGPVEATAYGNAIVQLTALGELHGIDEARGIISNSGAQVIYAPQDVPDVYDKYREIIGDKYVIH